jgi:hypothetical protein
VCQQLHDALVALQTGASKDTNGWVVPLEDMGKVVASAAEEGVRAERECSEVLIAADPVGLNRDPDKR